MVDQKNKIDDAAMENVIGGKATVVQNKDGSYVMKDKNGKVATFTPAQWQKLLSNWSWDGAPVSCILDQTVEDLYTIIATP
jgi:hypothetical protein